MHLRFSISLAAAIILSGQAFAFAQQTETQTPWRVELLELHNTARKTSQLPPFQRNEKLSAAAQRHAVHMAQTGKFDHQGIGDGDIPARIAAAGYQAKAHAENLLWGPSKVEIVHQAWMESELHRANILGNFREIGFGRATAENGRIYWVAVFGVPRQ